MNTTKVEGCGAVAGQVERPVRPHGECHNGHKFKTECPNMKEREDCTSMRYEHYDCKVCGAHVALDYEEMR